MTIIAVIAGANNWSEIAMYFKGKIRMFQEKFLLNLENRIQVLPYQIFMQHIQNCCFQILNRNTSCTFIWTVIIIIIIIFFTCF